MSFGGKRRGGYPKNEQRELSCRGPSLDEEGWAAWTRPRRGRRGEGNGGSLLRGMGGMFVAGDLEGSTDILFYDILFNIVLKWTTD